MNNNNSSQNRTKIGLGIVAHVDAGKTTLAEAMLYKTEVIKSVGRVDHGDTFLDTADMEKKRGITIFSKQARFSLPHWEVTLIDTPGHVDFASEAERALSIMDYAILVISGVDGVQSHTLTLWSLLKRYNVPVFIFVNKVDISSKTESEIISDLSSKLDHGCTNFTSKNEEDIASCDEQLMELYLDKGTLNHTQIQNAVKRRKLFPVFFGSALRLTGVEEMLLDIDSLMTKIISADDAFSCRVYKITRDSFATRLTHVKILSGSVKVKSEFNNEKINQIRFYSGEKFDTSEFAVAGDICAFTGLTTTFAGQVIGENVDEFRPILSPVMSYRLILPSGSDVHFVFRELSVLAEELPELSLVHLPETNEIQAQIMGEIQIEVLRTMIKDRLNLDVEFGVGSIIYKETVSGISEGVGHFEPLRHYAEVHLKIEPAPRGTGIQIKTDVSEDELDKNWQRLICTHIAEKRHKGVLTGSTLTDVIVTLVGGRAHQKHTEGGDFRQATYRAIRHGLMYNSSVLLEPWYDFVLVVPGDKLGRAMTDITKMCGEIITHEIKGSTAVVYGRCPVSTMHGYALELNAFTKGEGKLTVSAGGYDRCHNSEEIIDGFGYNPESDLRNTPDSVFCAQGSGFVVPWNEVTNYMHLPPCIKSGIKYSVPTTDIPINMPRTTGVSLEESYNYSASAALDKELVEIFKRTYGSKHEDDGNLYNPVSTKKRSVLPEKVEVKSTEVLEEYLLVDGYNIIFSWPELNRLSVQNLAAARDRLADILCNYQGFRKVTLILVFDAYKVSGGVEKVEEYNNIHIVYTKEAETADRYIERTTKKLTKRYRVTVATSDATEQVIIWGAGASRMSANDLLEAVNNADRQVADIITQKEKTHSSALIDSLPEESKALLNRLKKDNM